MDVYQAVLWARDIVYDLWQLVHPTKQRSDEQVSQCWTLLVPRRKVKINISAAFRLEGNNIWGQQQLSSVTTMVCS